MGLDANSHTAETGGADATCSVENNTILAVIALASQIAPTAVHDTISELSKGLKGAITDLVQAPSSFSSASVISALDGAAGKALEALNPQTSPSDSTASDGAQTLTALIAFANLIKAANSSQAGQHAYVLSSITKLLSDIRTGLLAHSGNGDVADLIGVRTKLGADNNDYTPEAACIQDPSITEQELRDAPADLTAELLTAAHGMALSVTRDINLLECTLPADPKVATAAILALRAVLEDEEQWRAFAPQFDRLVEIVREHVERQDDDQNRALVSSDNRALCVARWAIRLAASAGEKAFGLFADLLLNGQRQGLAAANQDQARWYGLFCCYLCTHLEARLAPHIISDDARSGEVFAKLSTTLFDLVRRSFSPRFSTDENDRIQAAALSALHAIDPGNSDLTGLAARHADPSRESLACIHAVAATIQGSALPSRPLSEDTLRALYLGDPNLPLPGSFPAPYIAQASQWRDQQVAAASSQQS